MGKRLMLILACALIVGVALPAYAEVQNIKVSGDILIQSVGRQSFNLDDDEISEFLSTVRLRLDADLTENVQAVVRLINERSWDEETNVNSDIDLDLAYISLKEFLYSPLTLILGRQNLRYGTGFIVGDPDTNQFSEYNHYSGVQADTVTPEDLSSRKAFDAIRAILDYDPLVIDFIFAKIDEATIIGTAATPESDDVDLYGFNVAYDWGTTKNIQQEAYLFVKDVSSDGGTGGQASLAITDQNNDITYTLGTRASIEPIERLYVSGEVAWQFGDKFINTANAVSDMMRERNALAFQVVGQYALNMKYNPVLTTVFTHYSGDKDVVAGDPDHSNFTAWDPMFEDQGAGKIYNALFSATNINVLEFKGKVNPIDDVAVSFEYALLSLDKSINYANAGTAGFWAPNDYAAGLASGGYTANPLARDLGQEFDVVLTYDYTEDVQFGLNAGIFWPDGELFTNINDKAAQQVIASVKVAF